MQLARLKAYKETLSHEIASIGNVKNFFILYRTSAGWRGEDGTTLPPTAITAAADLCVATRVPHKPPKGLRAFFPVVELDAVVVVDFLSSPVQKTRERFSKTLASVKQRADDSFDARHDPLTGLYNRRSFDELLNRALADAASHAASHSLETTVQERRSVSVVAFDVDHFKQVNDTFGHLYGDIVLQGFAARLTDAVSGLVASYPSVTFELARTGGEEFSLLIAGDISDQAVRDVAELLRRSVRDRPLPDDGEWETLTNRHHASGIRLPHAAERQVTTSVGTATVVTFARKSVHDLASRLQNQADTALSRAKSGGRDTVRDFAEIVARCGTVLEQHADTGIVAVDIGREVGVNVGQEFVVYHPDFTGTQPFLRSDGRTTRRLGGYPRHPSGRVVVFDVQPDIAFCRVVERSIPALFPPGSALEVVPLGAIGHLIAVSGADAVSVPGLTPLDGFQQRVNTTLGSLPGGAVVVIGLDNSAELASERGSSFVNRALANLFTSMRSHAAAGVPICQIHATQFAAILTATQLAAAQNFVRDCIAGAENQSGTEARFGAGVYTTDLGKAVIDGGDLSKLDGTHALEYARFAASTATPEHNICVFVPNVASVIVSAHYSAHRFRDGLVDYHRLRDVGVVNASLETLGGLCALAIGESEKELALEASKRAMTLAPDSDTYVANAAYVEYQFGNPIEAAKLFSRVREPAALPDVYKAQLALAFAAAYEAQLGYSTEESVTALLSDAINAAGVSPPLKLECARTLARIIGA